MTIDLESNKELSSTEECTNCKIKIVWEDIHEVNGIMWSCENCDNLICSKCVEYRTVCKSGIGNMELILCNSCT